MAKGHRWSTIAGEGGVIPVILKRRIVPTGEPDNTERVPSGSVGGWGKRSVSYLARSLPNAIAVHDNFPEKSPSAGRGQHVQCVENTRSFINIFSEDASFWESVQLLVCPHHDVLTVGFGFAAAANPTNQWC